MDIRELDRIALRETVRVLEQAGADDWALPTPCGDWNLRRLVSHMTAQHHGFAAAARGDGADPEVWREFPSVASPLDAYREAVEQVVIAFGRDGVMTREFALPEISATTRFPASLAIGFHFLDQVVHGWDIARALGTEPRQDPRIAEAALLFALRVPDDERRLLPNAMFAPSLPPPRDAGPMDLALASLGRSPDWTPPRAPRSPTIQKETIVIPDLRANIARRLDLTEQEVFDGRPLSSVLVASPTAINSIDLLDAFAGALADIGADEDVELPAMTLDHTAQEVVAALSARLVAPESLPSDLPEA